MAPSRIAQRSMLGKGRNLMVSSRRLQSPTVEVEQGDVAPGLHLETTEKTRPPQRTSALAVLPLSAVLRSLIITTISGSSMLLTPSLRIMSTVSRPQSILSPDRSALMKMLLKHTIYKQFCAGENEAEVRPTVAALKDLGLKGVILNYAKEVIIEDDGSAAPAVTGEISNVVRKEVDAWKSGTLATVSMLDAGDFIAMKWTGAGSIVVDALKGEASMPAVIDEATTEICDLALSRGVQILIDAEQACLQPTVDQWALDVMRKYNSKASGKAVIYNTYQAYLKSIPTVLSEHLAIARKEQFTLGVKLVRGAYLGTDPRHLIHDTKADTDQHHDGIAESLVTMRYNDILRPAAGESSTSYPRIDVVLAGHNAESIRKVQAIRSKQAASGAEQIELVYAQLQGMADEITCELMQLAQQAARSRDVDVDVPRAYKYISWGTVGECMGFLYRRGQENKDAAQRTRDTRNAMWVELTRRMKRSVGLRY